MTETTAAAPVQALTPDILTTVDGAAEAAERIRNDAARDAFRELLRAAVVLHLRPCRIDLGKETGFGFGPKRYPLCRVNIGKGIAFHGDRRAEALIIRAAGDHAFRLATGNTAAPRAFPGTRRLTDRARGPTYGDAPARRPDRSSSPLEPPCPREHRSPCA